MRPLTIELKYFGPYKHQLIDFTQFKDQSLFLVAGNTGAGKTTIFDAMCYALFGQTTNDRDRSAAALRSDFAPTDQETMVKFTFEHQGHKYQVMRRPKQVLEGRKGNLIEHNQAVDLIYPLEDSHPHEVTKIKEADRFITELLNLTRDQFKQIVLLPQGKFRQFLDSDSNTKETLLRDLFNTSRYERLAQQLKDNLREQKKTLNTQETKLQSLKETVTEIDSQLTTTDWLSAANDHLAHLKADLAGLKDEEVQQQKTINALDAKFHAQQELKKNIEALTEVRKALTALKAQQVEIDAKKHKIATIEWYQKHQTDYQRWVDGETRLCNLNGEEIRLQKKQHTQQQKQVQIKAELDDANTKQKETDQLQAQLTDLVGKLPLFKERDELTSDVSELETKLRAQTTRQQNYEQRIKKIQQQLTALATNLKEHDGLNDEQISLAKQQGKHEKLTTEALNLEQLMTNLTAEKQHRHKLDNQIKRAQKAAEDDQTRLAELNDQFARHQIALLAQKLKPNTPCPICGSLDHPHPARLKDDDNTLVTEEEVTIASKQAQQSQSTLVRLEEQEKQVIQSIENLMTQVGTAQNNVIRLMKLDELPADWRNQITERTQQLKQLEVKLNQTARQIKIWQQEQAEFQHDLTLQQDQLKQVEDKVNQLNQQLIAKKTLLSEKEQALPDEFSTKQAVEKQITTYKKQIDEFNHHLESLQKLQQENNQALAVTHSQLQQVQNDITSQKVQQTGLREKLIALLKQYDPHSTWDFWQEAAEQLPLLESLRTKITAYENQVRDEQRQEAQLTELVKDQPLPSLKETQTLLTVAQGKASQQQQAIGKLTANYQQLAKANCQINNLINQTGKLNRAINELQTLTDVVTGNTENHVSLERYVLQAYFQDVLVTANVQLDRLTNGRYQFELATESHGAGAKWSGLEVNVYDDNAGRTRSARTLSGGESFMASLALALALCQIIQEQSGGIEIDALFIDEGFGSLDQQALDDALHALQELEGRRMIGIISHVTELENQIPNQLLVQSHNGRSSVTYQHEF
ncbi:AAA family ATPase [Limosilactobacillus caviae]|uniref:Nuclease SbcCD subunit C n=1 Tax=Limosilactobacillus caviae TaxID=1769424 RepID=A0ABQ2C7C3_9LACO|nr:SMC family ATPase [Limosilactobacillus caviae]MCD7124068.1 SMC family ATPase [Limosilactobacillus caviae]GGI64197.1 nuclease SbcCD subunit C [Limosilactobacillus caviae]